MDPLENALIKALDHTIWIGKKYFKTIHIDKTEFQKICVAPFLSRSARKAHAINTLIKERLIEEAESILRILIEISFVVCAISSDKEFAIKYGRSAWAQKKTELSSLLQGIKEMNPPPVGPEQIAHIEKQLADVSEKVKKLQAKKLQPKDYAAKAGLLADYFSTYSKLCSSVHSGPEDLERFFQKDIESGILRIGKPAEGRVDVLLWTAIEAHLRILKAAAVLFTITMPELQELDRLHSELGRKFMSELKTSG